MSQNIFNGISVLTFILFIILSITLLVKSENINIFDLSEFKTVPESLKKDYANKSIPQIQELIKENLTDKGYLDVNSQISNAIIYSPCLLSNILNVQTEGCDNNFCRGDSDCLKYDANGSFAPENSGFCHNYQCQKVNDTTCSKDEDCLFSVSGNLQTCDNNKCRYAPVCTNQTIPPFSIPPIYDKSEISCNDTNQPMHYKLTSCNLLTKCNGKTCHNPKGNLNGICINSTAPS